MEEKSKPKRWLMWLVVGLVLLVGYPLSYGPYNWLEFQGIIPAPVRACFSVFYAPLVWALRNGPQPVMDWFNWYMIQWIAP